MYVTLSRLNFRCYKHLTLQLAAGYKQSTINFLIIILLVGKICIKVVSIFFEVSHLKQLTVININMNQVRNSAINILTN